MNKTLYQGTDTLEIQLTYQPILIDIYDMP